MRMACLYLTEYLAIRMIFQDLGNGDRLWIKPKDAGYAQTMLTHSYSGARALAGMPKEKWIQNTKML